MMSGLFARTGHYQQQLANWLRVVQPKVMVETGVERGLSTDAILRVMDEIGIGHLYSCDPSVGRVNLPDWTAVKHPRWTFNQMTSLMALPRIYKETGPWDVFLHDSDHDVECQVLEYSFAYWAVKPGGYILSDDHTWGSPPHHAWKKFCERYNLSSQAPLGHCAWVQKPLDDGLFKLSMQAALSCAVELAHTAAVEYGDKPKYFLELECSSDGAFSE
mgnify:CR=1 FL=1